MDMENFPKYFPNVEYIKRITAGENHLLILTTDDSLFGIGNKRHLGLNESDYSLRTSNLDNFQLTLIKYHIKKMVSGYNHNLALDKDNDVYYFGDNSKRQLGSSDDLVLFSKSNRRIKAQNIFASGDFSAIDIKDSDCTLKYKI